MMELFSSVKNLAILLFFVAITVACKQPETIVVDRSPETVAQQDTSDESTIPQEGFQQLNIGENQAIHSLDPLLTSNKAEYRAIQLIYEGLVRFNSNGKIVPALARQWSTDNNNRRFTFHLRPDAYFQDSNIFGSGTGRKVTARDVKFVFERMAHGNTPPTAAQPFMHIKGFNAYFQEQRHVYNPQRRQLSGISGITAPNDTTVTFELNQSDPDFLNKLATPLAVIYPKEAVPALDQSFAPVGSGPFRLAQQANDSTLILSKFSDYYAAPQVKLNRVDIITTNDEASLWNALESGTIHYVPSLGPRLTGKLLASQGDLKTTYTAQFTLAENGQFKLLLHHNAAGNLPKDTGHNIATLAKQDQETLLSGFSPEISGISFSTDDSQTSSASTLQLVMMNTENPFEKQLLQNLSQLLEKQGAQVQISNISVPTEQTDLFITQQDSLIPSPSWGQHSTLIHFMLQTYSLKKDSIQGLSPNQYSWWIDLRNTQLSDNLNEDL